ncbi:hypothetical protein JOE11_003450 [Robbsia andropogonis]
MFNRVWQIKVVFTFLIFTVSGIESLCESGKNLLLFACLDGKRVGMLVE